MIRKFSSELVRSIILPDLEPNISEVDNLLGLMNFSCNYFEKTIFFLFSDPYHRKDLFFPIILEKLKCFIMDSFRFQERLFVITLFIAGILLYSIFLK